MMKYIAFGLKDQIAVVMFDAKLNHDAVHETILHGAHSLGIDLEYVPESAGFVSVDDPIDAYVNKRPITFFGRSETLDTSSNKDHAGAVLGADFFAQIEASYNEQVRQFYFTGNMFGVKDLTVETQKDIVEKFNKTFRYLRNQTHGNWQRTSYTAIQSNLVRRVGNASPNGSPVSQTA